MIATAQAQQEAEKIAALVRSIKPGQPVLVNDGERVRPAVVVWAKLHGLRVAYWLPKHHKYSTIRHTLPWSAFVDVNEPSPDSSATGE